MGMNGEIEMSDLLIPEGMKPWHGGDAAPVDWDGGPVLYRNGVIANVSFSARWLKGFHEAEDDIIAYP